MTERVGQQLGHYRLQRLLGQGGFADVYLGEHIHLKSVAAIKVLQTRLAEGTQKDFLREAQMLARLLHPHIIRVLDFGIDNGVPYLVMDYAPGGTLRQRHGYNTKLPLATVVDYMQQIGEGLQYAHGQKLIHRDLKPENVLIGPGGDLLLSDFGVALMAQSTCSQEVRVNLAGTASYIAPEQLGGKPEFASDQYALGIMAYEWLCGTRPFKGSLIELYNQHYQVPPPPLREHAPELPEAVERVVLKAMAKNPEQRYECVKDFVEALREASEPTQVAGVFQDETVQMQEPVTAALPDTPRVSLPGISQAAIPAMQSTQPQQIATPTGEQPLFAKGGMDDRRKRPSTIKILLLTMLALVVILSSGAVALYAFSASSHKQVGKVMPASTPQATMTGAVPTAGGQAVAKPTKAPALPTPTVAPVSSTPVATSVAATPTATPVPVMPTATAIAPTPTPKPKEKPAPTATLVPAAPAAPMCPAQIESGSTGTWVKTLQTDLNTDYNNHSFSNAPFNFSPPLMADGIFGPMTTAAVKDYQSAKGLEVDGIVGPKTWHALGYC